MPLQSDIGLGRPGINILELGAGCGLLGLTLARNLPDAALVCITEQPHGGALEHLRANVAANRARLPTSVRVEVCACDWRAFAQEYQQCTEAGLPAEQPEEWPSCMLGLTGWDFIVGA